MKSEEKQSVVDSVIFIIKKSSNLLHAMTLNVIYVHCKQTFLKIYILYIFTFKFE